jgi:Zn-dependent protease with chaperone function
MQGSRDNRGSWLALYAVTVALEVPTILVRYVTVWVVAAAALKATGGTTESAMEWAKLLALAPTAWSLAALVNPAGGGWWWQQQLGGRDPSGREYVAYMDALEQVESAAGLLLRRPRRWFVLDERACSAAVCGDSLMLSRGLLESAHLPAVLAHELGHLQGVAARLTAALNRLTLTLPKRGGSPPPSPQSSHSPGYSHAPLHPHPPTVVINQASASAVWELLSKAARMWLALVQGGLGLRMTAAAWGAVWRKQEYEADLWAARLGEGEALADFLETEALPYDHPIPLAWLTDHPHPPTELRVERLRAQAVKLRKEA